MFEVLATIVGLIAFIALILWAVAYFNNGLSTTEEEGAGVSPDRIYTEEEQRKMGEEYFQEIKEVYHPEVFVEPKPGDIVPALREADGAKLQYETPVKLKAKPVVRKKKATPRKPAPKKVKVVKKKAPKKK